MSKLVISFLGEYTIEYTSEVACCCVFGLYGIAQVVQVGMIGVLDTKSSTTRMKDNFRVLCLKSP